MRLGSIFFASCVVLSCGCNGNEFLGPGRSGLEARTLEENIEPTFVVDSEAGRIDKLTVGMVEEDLKRAGYEFELSRKVLEGDEYKLYRVSLAKNVDVSCLLGLQDLIYRISTFSVKIRDSNDLGVGSTLKDLQQAYPSGRLIIGIEEGRYASFLTGSHLVFHFDPADINADCFQSSDSCRIDGELTVNYISIETYALD